MYGQYRLNVLNCGENTFSCIIHYSAPSSLYIDSLYNYYTSTVLQLLRYVQLVYSPIPLTTKAVH